MARLETASGWCDNSQETVVYCNSFREKLARWSRIDTRGKGSDLFHRQSVPRLRQDESEKELENQFYDHVVKIMQRFFFFLHNLKTRGVSPFFFWKKIIKIENDKIKKFYAIWRKIKLRWWYDANRIKNIWCHEQKFVSWFFQHHTFS